MNQSAEFDLGIALNEYESLYDAKQQCDKTGKTSFAGYQIGVASLNALGKKIDNYLNSISARFYNEQ